MNKYVMILASVALFGATSFAAVAADTPTAMESLANKGKNAANQAASDTLETWEINNIEKRRILNGKPGLVTYVVFLSKSGQPIDYFPANGKCTSSEKRLTPGDKLVQGDGGEHYADFVMKAASEDGTYGSSAPYIYCFTTDGKYKQWNGQYYVSDAPIELTIKPLIIDASGKNQQQQ